MNLKRIRKFKRILTLVIVLATVVQKYFKIKEKNIKNKDKKEQDK